MSKGSTRMNDLLFFDKQTYFMHKIEIHASNIKHEFHKGLNNQFMFISIHKFIILKMPSLFGGLV